MKLQSRIFLLILFFLSNFYHCQNLVLGNENFLANEFTTLKNKSLALVVNKASVTSNGTFLIDSLLSLKANIVKIFTFEHGLKLNAEAGENVENTNYKGVPVISLYGKKKTPSKNDLRNVDAIVYDIQDVGVRFFTYISSLKLLMKSIAGSGIPIYVLDRPNPQGDKIEGEILNDEFRSFVGIENIPVVYGLTIGELALLFKDRIEKETGKKVLLEVVKMKNYKRNRNYFLDGDLKWLPPSPNLRTHSAALLYPGLCFLEATNISEGRGTKFPFEQFGSPFINADSLLKQLKEEFAKELIFEKVSFTPKNKGEYYPKLYGKKCYGIKIAVKNKNFNSVLFGIKLLKILKNLYPDKISFNYNWLAKLYGNRNAEKYLKEEIEESELISKMLLDRKEFNLIRENYYLY